MRTMILRAAVITIAVSSLAVYLARLEVPLQAQDYCAICAPQAKGWTLPTGPDPFRWTG